MTLTRGGLTVGPATVGIQTFRLDGGPSGTVVNEIMPEAGGGGFAIGAFSGVYCVMDTPVDTGGPLRCDGAGGCMAGGELRPCGAQKCSNNREHVMECEGPLSAGWVTVEDCADDETCTHTIDVAGNEEVACTPDTDITLGNGCELGNVGETRCVDCNGGEKCVERCTSLGTTGKAWVEIEECTGRECEEPSPGMAMCQATGSSCSPYADWSDRPGTGDSCGTPDSVICCRYNHSTSFSGFSGACECTGGEWQLTSLCLAGCDMEIQSDGACDLQCSSAGSITNMGEYTGP